MHCRSVLKRYGIFSVLCDNHNNNNNNQNNHEFLYSFSYSFYFKNKFLWWEIRILLHDSCAKHGKHGLLFMHDVSWSKE